MPRITGASKSRIFNARMQLLFVEAEPVVLVSSLMLRHARQQDFGAVSNVWFPAGAAADQSRLGGREQHSWCQHCTGTPGSRGSLPSLQFPTLWPPPRFL